MTKHSTDEVLFEQRGVIGHILLNRPKALNSLTLEMALAMTAQLLDWSKDNAIEAVVVEGAGEKGFCAGGDIRALYESGQSDGAYARKFYFHEYQLNHLIKKFPKPYIALIDGVTMGGGVGVSVHGSHRVAGDRTLFAMPETGIGLFPDVGGTYFLPRLPHRLGYWLGLSGDRLKAADSVYAGVATHYVPSDSHPALVDAFASGQDPDEAIARFVKQLDAPLAARTEKIEAWFADDSLPDIFARLEADGSEDAAALLANMKGKSPISMIVAARQLAEGAALEFDECMILEYRLARRFVEGKDFYEGVRAVIIDKDNAPIWGRRAIEDVTNEEVAAYFAPLDQELEFLI